MDDTKLEELLELAQTYIPDPDVIIDVFDMTYEWVSDYHCEVTEYSREEEIGMRISENSQLVDGDTEQIAPEAGKPYEKFTRKMVLTTKSGKKMDANVEGIVIEFENQPYLVGKMDEVMSTEN